MIKKIDDKEKKKKKSCKEKIKKSYQKCVLPISNKKKTIRKICKSAETFY